MPPLPATLGRDPGLGVGDVELEPVAHWLCGFALALCGDQVEGVLGAGGVALGGLHQMAQLEAHLERRPKAGTGVEHRYDLSRCDIFRQRRGSGRGGIRGELGGDLGSREKRGGVGGFEFGKFRVLRGSTEFLEILDQHRKGRLVRYPECFPMHQPAEDLVTLAVVVRQWSELVLGKGICPEWHG